MNISCSGKSVLLLQTSKIAPVIFLPRGKIVNISGIEISEKSFNGYISDVVTINNKLILACGFRVKQGSTLVFDQFTDRSVLLQNIN